MREKKIRLSEEEKCRLDSYRRRKWDEQCPYGMIVSKLLDKVEGEQ